MEGTVWRKRADPLQLVRVIEYHSPGITVVQHLPARPGAKGKTEVNSEKELRQHWDQTSPEEWEASLLKFAPPSREEDAPDMIGAIFGFRVWQLDAAGYLSSQGLGNTTWESGRNVAVCAQDFGDGHRAPIANCGCGLYAYHDPDEIELIRFPGGTFPIAGIVRAWGDMEVHEAGFRAEYAEIVALCLPWPAIVEERPVKFQLWDAFGRAVERYGVEVINSTPADMRAWVTEQKDGDVVPPEMRPEFKPVSNEVFWAPPLSMTNSGGVRINGQAAAQAETFELRSLKEDEEPEEKPERMMYVGEVLYPGFRDKMRAVAYLKMSRHGRFIVKHGDSFNWFLAIVYCVFTLGYLAGCINGVVREDWVTTVLYLFFTVVWARLSLIFIKRARYKT